MGREKASNSLGRCHTSPSSPACGPERGKSYGTMNGTTAVKRLPKVFTSLRLTSPHLRIQNPVSFTDMRVRVPPLVLSTIAATPCGISPKLRHSRSLLRFLPGPPLPLRGRLECRSMQIDADRCELYGTIVGTKIQCHVTTVGTIYVHVISHRTHPSQHDWLTYPASNRDRPSFVRRTLGPIRSPASQ